MKQSIRLFAALLLMTAFSGCAGLSRKFDSNRAHAVRKVAVLGFEVFQEQQTDNLGLASLMSVAKNGATGDAPELKAMGQEIYQDLLASMAERSSWKTVSLDTLRSNKHYAAEFTRAMTGPRQISFAQKNTELIFVQGVLDQTALRKMSAADKAKLAREVGADAYAEFQVIESIHQGWGLGNINGTAPFQFTARANLRVFDLASEEPLWQIQNVDGDKTPSSKELPEGMTKNQKLAKLGAQAARSAIQKLTADFGK